MDSDAVKLAEGLETPEFWSLLGGKGEHTHIHTLEVRRWRCNCGEEIWGGACVEGGDIGRCTCGEDEEVHVWRDVGRRMCGEMWGGACVERRCGEVHVWRDVGRCMCGVEMW